MVNKATKKTASTPRIDTKTVFPQLCYAWKDTNSYSGGRAKVRSAREKIEDVPLEENESKFIGVYQLVKVVKGTRKTVIDLLDV